MRVVVFLGRLCSLPKRGFPKREPQASKSHKQLFKMQIPSQEANATESSGWWGWPGKLLPHDSGAQWVLRTTGLSSRWFNLQIPEQHGGWGTHLPFITRPPYMWRGTKEPADESERGEWKTQHSKKKIMASDSVISRQINGETVEIVTDFILGGSKISADGDCSHEIKRCLLLGRKWKWSHVRLFATPWTVAFQAPLSMGFSRQ